MTTPEMPKPPRIDIVELSTGKVIKSLPLQHVGERYVERVMRGLLSCNFDSDRFCAREVLK